MRKHNRNSPPGGIKPGEGLLLSFRIERGNEIEGRRGGGNETSHSRRALPEARPPQLL